MECAERGLLKETGLHFGNAGMQHSLLEQIARQAEFTPRNVQTVGECIKQVFAIKVRLDNREGKLRAGMAADVRFPNITK